MVCSGATTRLSSSTFAAASGLAPPFTAPSSYFPRSSTHLQNLLKVSYSELSDLSLDNSARQAIDELVELTALVRTCPRNWPSVLQRTGVTRAFVAGRRGTFRSPGRSVGGNPVSHLCPSDIVIPLRSHPRSSQALPRHVTQPINRNGRAR